MEDKIITYKGMDSKMQCRGMQYAVGKEFSVDGDIECCGNGLHASEIRDGIGWVIVYRTGRSWHALTVWSDLGNTSGRPTTSTTPSRLCASTPGLWS